MIMGFTTPAFIRKNTPELRKKLKELGYKLIFSVRYAYTDVIYAHNDYVYGDIPKNYTENGVVDCGTNESLFLAIAALRDDTNENQWFTNGEEWAYHPKTECCSPCTTIYKTLAFDYIPNDVNLYHYHKATVEELIEHFKGKEENK
jgi:hypothetical protein